MQFSAIHKKLIVSTEDLSRAADGFLYAMRKYRQSFGVPLTKRGKQNANLSDFDMAERELLQSCKSIGVDFGVEWGRELDLTEIS